jgi:hypothetical protein
MRFWKRASVDMNIRNNFDIPDLRERSMAGRMHDVISLIAGIVAAIIPSLATSGVIVAGIGALSWASIIATVVVVGAVIGFAAWSATSGAGGRSGSGIGGSASIDQNGQLVNTRQAAKVLPILYGIVRVGGNWIFSRPSSFDNNVFNVIVTWGEGDIEGIATAIDFTPLYNGSTLNDIHTGGTFVSGSCSCNGPCYLHTGCSCDMACDNTYA